MKKILFLNCACTGSTGKIISDTAAYISKRGYTCVRVVPRRTDLSVIKTIAVCLPHEQGINRRIGLLRGNLFGFAPLSTHKILRALKTERPDIVHIHCVNGSMVQLYTLLDYLKKHRIPTVVTNHAEFFYTGSCDHAYDCALFKTGCAVCPQGFRRSHRNWEQMRTAFTGFERLAVTSVSPWVYARSCASPILQGISQSVITNGISTETFQIKSSLPSVPGLGGAQKLIVHVTASFTLANDKKGSRYVLELADRLLAQNVHFLIIGPVHGELPQKPNVHYIGMLQNQEELAAYYSMADVCLLTGKRETFSMPVAEALCCGTPVVGFEAGGPESIALPDYTAFCPFGEVASLETLLREKWLHFKTPELASEISAAAQKKYSSAAMAEKYLAVYERLT